jgi:hypothetical protein
MRAVYMLWASSVHAACVLRACWRHCVARLCVEAMLPSVLCTRSGLHAHVVLHALVVLHAYAGLNRPRCVVHITVCYAHMLCYRSCGARAVRIMCVRYALSCPRIVVSRAYAVLYTREAVPVCRGTPSVGA